ncbi:acyl-CoA dehydrogenase family protein [Streptomyces sp. NPDC058457]|uniref:acyl-CoA dehydrogenase family protein n=1 Tax=Streptomyces sp. NPDC058457 TaxID=3346507 RepID=UPI00365103D6
MTADAEIEKELREALGGLLHRRCDIETVAALADGPESWDRELWQELRDMGVPGLAVPEEYGGEGAGFSLAVAAQEELGRRLAPVPTVSIVAAQAALLTAGTDEAAGWLRRMTRDGVTAALAVGRSADGWSRAPGMRAEDGSGEWTLTGTVPVVADAPCAAVFLVTAETAAGPALFAVEPQNGCVTTPVDALDPTRPLGAVALTDCPARRVAGPDTFGDVLGAAERAALVLLAADAVGVAAEAMDLAVKYARTRHQFGRAIGTFQAVSHRCANMLIAVESARALVAAAAGALDEPGPDTDTAVCLAAAEALETAVSVAQGCVQVHGGMGFTWEHPAHRYLRRAKAAEALVALPDRLRERAATGLLAAV